MEGSANCLSPDEPLRLRPADNSVKDQSPDPVRVKLGLPLRSSRPPREAQRPLARTAAGPLKFRSTRMLPASEQESTVEKNAVEARCRGLVTYAD